MLTQTKKRIPTTSERKANKDENVTGEINMIELPIYDKKGKQVDTLKIDEAMLGTEVRPTLLKQAYVMFHSNRRQGSARTKSRGMVEGSTRKIYKQKGTGNARMGQVRSNIRKGGGVTFAKTRTHEHFRKDMPKKMRQLANRNALLAKLVDGEVKCIVDLDFAKPKTSDFKAILDAVGIDRSCLVAVDSENRNAAVSARNIEHVDTIRVDQLNVFELLNHRYLVVDKASMEAFLDGSAWKKEEEAA
ncbi:MAG TPA: 50S ribosomal protein L4 [Phycisphaerales bacterium]|nr:50S ribosomal protein L4 [Phycisphaerales bacterium]